MLEAGLHDLLETNTGSIGCSFWPGELPQGAPMPAGTYREIVSASEATLEASGFQRARFQFDSYGDTAQQAMQVRDGLRSFLNGYSGVLSDGTFLQNVDLISKSGPMFDQDRRKFYCIVELYLLYDFM